MRRPGRVRPLVRPDRFHVPLPPASCRFSARRNGQGCHANVIMTTSSSFGDRFAVPFFLAERNRRPFSAPLEE